MSHPKETHGWERFGAKAFDIEIKWSEGIFTAKENGHDTAY
jgi:hypothetical protein